MTTIGVPSLTVNSTDPQSSFHYQTQPFEPRPLQGWHRGELQSRSKSGFSFVHTTAHLFERIAPELDYDSALFYRDHVTLFPVTTLDSLGRPWGSILSSREGKVGFVEVGEDLKGGKEGRSKLLIKADSVWDRDPIMNNLQKVDLEKGGTTSRAALLAGIGVEFSTRRRNKVAGYVTKATMSGTCMEIELTANQALGNCPKYITIRHLKPVVPPPSPVLVHNKLSLDETERLPQDVLSFINEADTTFLATSYSAITSDEQARFPSHVGMNHRGGRPGFVRVKPSDGRTVVLPDFSGNRFMTSLGNVEATPFAGLSFVDFKTGDILMVTGNARILYGEEAQKVMPFQERLTEIYVTGYVFVRGALPVREDPNHPSQPSPYSPPIRFLAEETKGKTALISKEQRVTATLQSIALHTPTLATFTWKSSTRLDVKPGQAIILDFTPLIGNPQYQHMSPFRPSAVNDDYLRTWTVSSVVDPQEENPTFELTMKEKEGGVVTGALFNIARKMKEARPELLKDSTALNLNVGVVGVTGEFTLPVSPAMKSPASTGDGVQRFENQDLRPLTLVWIAGGIGITPFLSMLRALSAAPDNDASPSWDIQLIVSTREPAVILALIENSLQKQTAQPSPRIQLSIYLFSGEEAVTSPLSTVTHYAKGRITKSFFVEKKDVLCGNSSSLVDPRVAICGPKPFEDDVIDMLREVGVGAVIQRESFSY